MKKKKGIKISIMTLLTVFLLLIGSTSVFAAVINYESEPNDGFTTANTMIHLSYGENYGKISSYSDIDNWKFYTKSSRNHYVGIVLPENTKYTFTVYEYSATGYKLITSSNNWVMLPGDNTTTGLSREYYVVVSAPNGSYISPEYYHLYFYDDLP
ncbi:hypothetical protein [Paenibacillus motobuensis]|jgi:hypothetical protein|uniref:Uncharacterized protein n=1 Tax=Paenibacillus motobuensis TaxID=295324 RepID=A0ABN0YC80_9BACL